MSAQTSYGGLEEGNAGNGGGVSSSYFGYQSARLVTQGQRWNTMVGYRTGYNLINTDPNNNRGRENSFFGASTGASTTIGRGNTFIGQASGKDNTTGSYNTVVGMHAGYKNKSGSGNVMIGRRAGYWETGSNKLYIDNSTTSSPLIHGDFSTDLLTINGTMRIGNVTTPSGYKLYVDDGILTEKVKVATVGSADWADYVFEENYDLNSTEDVAKFIKENKHLPNVPSAQEVSENGVDMVEMDATLLRQIEELWLHMIELKKEMNKLGNTKEVKENDNQTITPFVEKDGENNVDIAELNANLLNQIEELSKHIDKLNKRIQDLEEKIDEK